MWSSTRCATDRSSIAAFIPSIPCPPFCRAYALQSGGQKKPRRPYVSPIHPHFAAQLARHQQAHSGCVARIQHGVTIDTKGRHPWPAPAAIEPKCRGDYRQSILVSPGSRDPIVRFSTKVVSHTLLSLPRRRLMTLGVVGTAAWGLTLEEAAAQTIEARHWQ